MHCLEARQGMLLAVFDLNIIAIGDRFQYRIKSSRVVSDIGLRQEPEGGLTDDLFSSNLLSLSGDKYCFLYCFYI
jgi:hypothetical protein